MPRLYSSLASVTGLISGVTDNVAAVGVTETGNTCVFRVTQIRLNHKRSFIHQHASQTQKGGRVSVCVCSYVTVCQCFLGTRNIVADYRDDRLGEEDLSGSGDSQSGNALLAEEWHFVKRR